MANAFYNLGKQRILNKEIDFDDDSIQVRLVRDTYTVDLATHTWLSSVTAVTGTTDQTLANKSIANGVFDADDVTFAAVPAGETAKAVVLYKHVTDASDSPLIAYIDTISGFPFATNGGNIVIQWDNGAYKIFSL